MVQRFPSNITVSAIPLPRVVEVAKDVGGRVYLLGSEGKFLNILAKVLRFKYNVNVPPDREWGRQTKDGNWTGMIGQVFRGESDFTLWTSITEDRTKAVDFSEPYGTYELTYVTTLPGYLPKDYAFIYPFDVITWCSIVLLIFVVPLLFWLLSSSGPSYFERLLYLFGTLMHQSLNDEHFYQRTLLGFWWIASLVLSVSYSGALSSFLSMPLRETPIRDFHELAVAVTRGQYRCLDVKGTVSIPGLLATGREDLALLANTIKKNNWYTTLKESQTETHFDGKTAHLGSRMFLYFRFGKAPFTRMYISEDTAFSSGMALGVRKDFCCKEELNSVIMKIKYAGIYNKILEDEMYNSWLKYIGSLKFKEINRPLSVQDLSGAIVVFAIGNGLSIVIFITEYCWKKQT
ncbi:glutamate receptor ionotropic, delta-2-like [Parasteatoda tepidariorum]|uniref:glutamate receptor ionotropic, delta-2-like n=1 Tax=Parasteatoda tepidariorum TaxID=114398 RepID=UPI00077FB20A|nr:glutamate receptor ionotropic, delta-2-like [Parasteatoda tepidariorum]